QDEPRRSFCAVILHQGRIEAGFWSRVVAEGQGEPVASLFLVQPFRGVVRFALENRLHHGKPEALVGKGADKALQRGKAARMATGAPVLETVEHLVAGA